MNACILVVDDDPEIVGAIAITLEREGYRVLRAYDGMEALDLALDPAVRLILIDVMMPKLDGLSALLRIRERRAPHLRPGPPGTAGGWGSGEAHRHGDKDRGPADA